MSFKSMRVVLVAALVAAILGGGVATAKTTLSNNSVTSAKIKNSSILGKDIKNKTIGIGKLSSGTQKLIRANGTGAKGATGPTGPQGPAGAQGPAGPAGPAGASFDPSKVSAATSQVTGFTPWYDSSAETKVAFTDGAITIDNGGKGIGGVNLPIARGTSLSALSSIKYASVSTDGSGGKGTRGAVLAIEIYTQGKIFSGDGSDYTTLYLAPSAAGETDAFAATNTWTSTKPANTGGKATGTWKELTDTIADKNKALILNASVRTFGSASDTKAAQAGLVSVSLGLRNAEKPVSYSFVK